MMKENISPEPNESSSNRELSDLLELGEEFKAHLAKLTPGARRLTVEKFKELHLQAAPKNQTQTLWRVFSILMATRTWRFAQLQEFGCPQAALSGVGNAAVKDYEAAIEAWIRLAERCW